MKKAAKYIVLLVIAGVALALAAQYQTSQPSKDLPNLHKVNENLYRGGQPGANGFNELKQLGIKTVIDLRDNDDRARKEEGLATSAGLKFINIPLANWARPDKTEIDSILKQIDEPANQPVFVHCRRGSDRTGTVMAVYRMTHDGWTGEQASKEAKEFGLGWWQFMMKDYISDYYRDLKSEKTSSPENPGQQ